jgi:UTP:GlnB (protein PII) uridylyltransferase
MEPVHFAVPSNFAEIWIYRSSRRTEYVDLMGMLTELAFNVVEVGIFGTWNSSIMDGPTLMLL